MTPCFAPDEFVDLVDGTLDARRQAHLETCAACRTMAAAVREALTLAAGAGVPEPSPLFWSSLNARVRAGIEGTGTGGWRGWLRWDVLVPMAGLAALVVALASAVERGVPVPMAGDAAAVAGADDVLSSDSGAGTDDALAMMIELADSLPEGGWDVLGVTALPEMGEAAVALSPEEQQALAALLASALDRPRS